MSEIALYRKYRPQKFKDVIGQDHVIQVLEGAIKLGNIAHAYLFAGSRGIGKTSIARIFAREIGTSDNDLYEIDAASNRGIDDIRAIRDSVATLPFESPFKVYIVDEVHMLTKEAFNALLKTLEEPPKHVIFILATTETEKLPETVVSRCQTFSFKKPNQQILRDVVLSVAKKEGFTLEPSAADLVAFLGDGSFRDTLGIVQKVVSASKDKKISIDEVELVTGAPRREMVNAIVEAIAEKNIEKGLIAVRKASGANIDPKTLLTLVVQKMRCALHLKLASGLEKEIAEEVSEEDMVLLKKLATGPATGITSHALAELLSAYGSIGYSAVPELPLELALVNIVQNAK
ncbi:MAG: DNA polymerase III subunit gamma/tau [Candidatus Paceibacterota bacterium]|jgi:DNA polymerase-3 subunit gamma/tau